MHEIIKIKESHPNDNTTKNCNSVEDEELGYCSLEPNSNNPCVFGDKTVRYASKHIEMAWGSKVVELKSGDFILYTTVRYRHCTLLYWYGTYDLSYHRGDSNHEQFTDLRYIPRWYWFEDFHGCELWLELVRGWNDKLFQAKVVHFILEPIFLT